MTNFLQWGLNYTLNSAIPYALDFLTNAVVQDPKMRDLALSVGMIGTGAALIHSSGILKPIQSWNWNTPNPHANESWKKTALRWSAAAVGAAGICCGVFNLVKEFVVPTEANPVLQTSDFSPTPAQTETPESSSEPPVESDDSHLSYTDRLIRDAITTLRSCPDADTLWKSVEQQGPFSVKYDSSVFGADTNSETRTIRVASPMRTKDSIEPLLFEVCNMKQSESLNALSKKACNLTADEFSKQTETMEYHSLISVYELILKCGKEFWDMNTDKIVMPEMAQVLKEADESLHTDICRLRWHVRCGDRFVPGGLSMKWLKDSKDKWWAASNSKDYEIRKRADILWKTLSMAHHEQEKLQQILDTIKPFGSK